MTDTFEQARQHFLQGIADFEAGRLEQAEHAFEASLALLPGRPSTLVNLGATKLRRSKPAEALAALDRQDALVPDQGVTWQRRGQLLQTLNRHDEALAAYEKALSLDRQLAQAWTLRGGILKDRGRHDEAAECYRQALAHGGDPELNGYFLASLVGRDAPTTAPPRYVQSLFDDYAETFDDHLVKVLRYEAPRFLIDNLRGVGPERFESALDLGCGTGLCGPLVKSAVRRLDGVDLSPRMLEKARALGLYDQLVHGDLVEHLRSTRREYDLVLSADVFIYVGDLEPVFAEVSRVMKDGGVFCFSVEQAGDEQTVLLNTHQRYAHSERYVRELAARHGFDVLRMLRHAIREDQREAIPGLYFYLLKV